MHHQFLTLYWGIPRKTLPWPQVHLQLPAPISMILSLTEKKPSKYLPVITVATSSSLNLLLSHSIQAFFSSTSLKPLVTHNQHPILYHLKYPPQYLKSYELSLPFLSSLLTWLPGYHSLLGTPSVSFAGSSTSHPLNVENVPGFNPNDFPQFWLS